MATESLRIEVAMLLSHYSNSLFIAVPLSMVNNNLPRRIIKETQRLLSEPAPGISATPSDDNMRYFNVPLFRSPLAKGLLLGSLPLPPYSDPFVFRQHCSCSANPILFKQPRFRSDLSYPLRSLRLEYSSMASASSFDAKSVYDFVVKDARGNDVDLSQYKGKVLLIVNVASLCGLTNSNYTELSELYTKYKDQGLEILAFPCNQFGTQEPGSNDQIVEFSCTRFKAEFPIFDKVDVNGDKAAPIYKFLKSSKGSLFGDGIKWNFTKFLVDKNGSVVERYAPTTSPSSIEAVSSSWNYFYLKGAVPDQDLPS